MNEGLKPCPFCGGDAALGVTRVWCSECRATLETDLSTIAASGQDTLITAWNARASETRPRAIDAAIGVPVPGPKTTEIVNDLSLHHSTAALLNMFMVELALKLAKAQEKYGYTDGWKEDDWQDECRRQLHHHAAKGDLLDVAAYAAFCFWHRWPTTRPDPETRPALDRESVADILDPRWAALRDQYTSKGVPAAQASLTADSTYAAQRRESLAKADAIIAMLGEQG